MGLGLQISALIERPGGTLERIAETIRSLVHEPLDRLLLDMDEEDGVFYVQLHPAEEPVRFVLDGGTLSVSAKTSSAGPGYHAWLVDVLDEIARRLQLAWDWSNHGNGEGDETGFRDSYDYTQLQHSMAGWLRALAGMLTEQDGSGGPIALSMPAGEGFVGDAFAVSPMGRWSRDWFEALHDADDGTLLDAAAEFFPAWHPRDDARYWLNCGSVLAWYALRWVTPEDDAERDLYKATLGCFARAHQMNPTIRLPEPEIREMWALLAGEREGQPPFDGGIGFRRGLMERPLGGGWTARLPGYFARRLEGDGSAVVYCQGAREVHATATLVAGPDDDSQAGAQAVRDKAAEADTDPYAFTFHDGHTLGWATSLGDAPNATMQAMLGSGARVCLLTVHHEDTDDGRDWAEATIRGVSCPAPDGDSAD